MFAVDNYMNFISTQSDSAIRQVARQYPYDVSENGDITTTLISMGLPSSSLTFCLSLLSVKAFNETFLPNLPKTAGFAAEQKGFTKWKPSVLIRIPATVRHKLEAKFISHNAQIISNPQKIFNKILYKPAIPPYK